jgi:hypothetical protein
MDEQVARRDPQLADLLDRFVCVRVVQANGLDLALFQYDFDLTWAVVFFNADRTVYGRYGTRGGKDGGELLSVAGLRASMQAALALHKGYPGNKAALAAKSPKGQAHTTPEQLPGLKPRFKATVDLAAPRKTCVHCHMVHEAQRKRLRDAGRPIPDEMLWVYPLPAAIGLDLDPEARAAVRRVVAHSPAAKADFRAKDELLRLHGQPIISVADVQWVLHHARDGEVLKAHFLRDGKEADLDLTLPAGWRRKDDFSWRTSTWDLRRMALGGLLLDELSDKERARRGLSADGLALLVRHAGEFGAHAVAKNAGFRKGDVLVAFAGQTSRRRECDLIAHAPQKTKPGDKVEVTVLRDGKRRTLRLPLQ